MDKKLIKHLLEKYINNPTEKNRDVIVDNVYAGNKDGHGVKHINTVLKHGAVLKGSKLNMDETLAIVFHDSDMHDRDNHHLNGAKLFRELAKGLLDQKRIDLIAAAIEEHRASYKGEFTSDLSDLVSSADRSNPSGDLNDYIARSYVYGRNKLKQNHKKAISHALEHIKEKYSRNGYQRTPKHYYKKYKPVLNKFWDSIDRLDIAQSEAIVDKYVKDIDKGEIL